MFSTPLTRIKRSGFVPSFGPRPFGGPVSEAYALRFFTAAVAGPLLLLLLPLGLPDDASRAEALLVVVVVGAGLTTATACAVLSPSSSSWLLPGGVGDLLRVRLFTTTGVCCCRGAVGVVVGWWWWWGSCFVALVVVAAFVREAGLGGDDLNANVCSMCTKHSVSVVPYQVAW